MIGSTKKIGILGGGQLGAMIIRSAIDFGLDISILDVDKSVSSAKYTSFFVEGNTLNYDDVYNFGKDLDIITIEKEAVNVAALKDLEKKGVKVFPTPDTIEIIQDKYHQKEFLIANNIPVAKGTAVNGIDEIKAALTEYPACLKMRRDGYDGNGVMMLHSDADVEQSFTTPSVLEECVDIKHEISVIVARNSKGDTVCYDATLMEFDKKMHLLDYQISPANIDSTLLKEANSFAETIANAINLVGILAVEMFITNDNKVIVNELAPRPHNSGHHTIEAAQTSQYEQLLRAILESPLGHTALTTPSVLINILAPQQEDQERVYGYINDMLESEGVHIHWYGKRVHKPGRKMGHIVVANKDANAAMAKAETIRENIKTT